MTEEQIEKLRALWPENISTSEIGRRIGVTKGVVIGKADRLGLPRRPEPIALTRIEWTDERIATLRMMWPDNTVEEIRARIGVSKSAVIGKAHVLKLPMKASLPGLRSEGDAPISPHLSREPLAPMHPTSWNAIQVPVWVREGWSHGDC